MPYKHLGIFLTCCWLLVISICGLLLYNNFGPTAMRGEILACGNDRIESPAANRHDSTFIEGKVLFQNNCASCHHPLKDATGPALAGIKSLRSSEWLCRFVTKPKFAPHDKRSLELQKMYCGALCVKFPQLNCKDVEAIFNFTNAIKY